MRRSIIAANWKMHFDMERAVEVARQMVEKVKSDSEIIVCPSFVFLDRLSGIFLNSQIKLGAQNMCFKEEGAFTGEVSPIMIRGVGCEYVILGHSERRHIFGENDVDIHKKVVSAIEHELKPIVCVGETLSERNNGKAFDIVERQIVSALDGVDLDKVVVAYEPVWAIGTGVAADNKTITEMHKFIREMVGDVSILYGGSVKDTNAKELAEIEDVDGFLVGSASLDAGKFSKIAEEFDKVKGGK
ncbi:triose-phosphate isomerase [Hippea alviniae]|uniref:triose-phosphate isomerase n=1 Tax=Hippea alviniae TaxID=1279027 RepID=UPI0003B3EB3A|nr:triose-phosphate isomerase [Hippea alviniae]